MGIVRGMSAIMSRGKCWRECPGNCPRNIQEKCAGSVCGTCGELYGGGWLETKWELFGECPEKCPRGNVGGNVPGTVRGISGRMSGRNIRGMSERNCPDECQAEFPGGDICLRLGSLTNPFHHRPFPHLPDSNVFILLNGWICLHIVLD